MNFKTNIEELDTREIVNSEYINWEFFKNSTIMITGATGLIGEQIVKSLLLANEEKDTNIKVLALVRNKKKALSKFSKNKNLKFIVQDISKDVKYSGDVDFIIHTANSTSSKDFVEKPVETINSIMTGTKNILKFGREKQIKGMIYLSSMEVFGKTDFERVEPLKEDDYGYIDIINTRSSYPEAKRLAETLCHSYFKEYGLPVKVARLVQTIGAGVDYNDNRVFAQFARNIVEKKNIVIKTTGKSARSYCYITDAITALFKLLEIGNNGESYNIANENTNCSIKELAYMLANKYQDSKVEFQLDNKFYPPATKLFVDITKLKALNWSAKIDLEEMFDRLVKNFISDDTVNKTIKTQPIKYDTVEYLNIVLASDNNYAPYCATTIASILKNIDNNTKCRFYILDGGISDINKMKIEKLKIIKDFSITYYDMQDIDWSNLPLNRKHISTATYYRLIITKLLPKDIDKIIYLDCDVIVNSNIRELYDYCIKDYYVAGIEDVTGKRESEKLNLEQDFYFNAGVILLNIKQLRSFDFYKKCVDYFNSNKDIITLQDQDILNGVLNRKVKKLPLNWNVNTRIYSKNNNEEFHNYSKLDEWNARNFPKIIHYSDKYKPWHKQCMHILKEEFYKYLSLTDFKKEKYIYLTNKYISNIFTIQTNFDVFQIKLFNILIYFVKKGKIKNIYLFGIKIYTRIKGEKHA